MRTIINNEGKKINVDEPTFMQLQSDYDNGIWSSTVTDSSNRINMVIIPDNAIELCR